MGYLARSHWNLVKYVFKSTETETQVKTDVNKANHNKQHFRKKNYF